MTADVVAELVKGAVALLLAIVGVGVGWDQVKRHGATDERLKQAEKELDRVSEQLERRSRPVPPDPEYRSRLQRAADRLARLRDRASKP